MLLPARTTTTRKSTMEQACPPEVKPMAAAATKTAEKKTKKADEITNLPAPKLPKIRACLIKAVDPLLSPTTQPARMTMPT